MPRSLQGSMPRWSLETSKPVTHNTSAAVIGGKRLIGAFMRNPAFECETMLFVKNGKCDFHTRIKSRIAGCVGE